MSTILNSGQFGGIGLKQEREKRALVTEAWCKTPLLNGLEGTMKENIAQLLENQATYMLYESTTSDSSGAFETVAFPVIRRIFAKLLANEIVSIQTMSMPIGRLYFYNPKISTRQNTTNNNHYVQDGVFSNAAANYSLDGELRRITKNGGTQYSTTSLYDSFYASEYDDEGTALYDRTNGAYREFTTNTIGTYTYDSSTSKVKVSLTGFSTTNDGKLVGPVGVPMNTEEFLASLNVYASVPLTGVGVTVSTTTPLTISLPPQKYGQPIVDKNGKLDIVVDVSGPNPTGTGYVPLVPVGPSATFTAVYRLYSDLEEDSEMAEVSFDMEFITVDVGAPKKLRATYSPEVQQDAAAFHNIDVEAELASLLSEIVSGEIDRTILRDLRRGCAWVERWDAKGYEKRIASGGIALTRKDYNQELITLINKISAQILKTTLRSEANWIVVSTEISAIFNDLEYFHASDASPESLKYSLGISKIGTLSNRFQVYVDVYAPANTLLIGCKGSDIFHTGYIYAPYTPLMLFPTMTRPNDFQKVMGIMTRYAKAMVNNRFYGKIIVDNASYYGSSWIH